IAYVVMYKHNLFRPYILAIIGFPNRRIPRLIDIGLLFVAVVLTNPKFLQGIHLILTVSQPTFIWRRLVFFINLRKIFGGVTMFLLSQNRIQSFISLVKIYLSFHLSVGSPESSLSSSTSFLRNAFLPISWKCLSISKRLVILWSGPLGTCRYNGIRFDDFSECGLDVNVTF